MSKERAFRTWYEAQGIRHFTAGEFLRYFERGRKGVTNSIPPETMWSRILPALRVVDALREHYGKSCTLLSSYRSDDYNAAVGGAKYSQHKEFRALDIRIKGVSARHVYNRLLKWRREGRFVGGLGLYTSSRFVHIDTRGRNATWKGN